jgi:hypothetical protein
VCLIHPNTSIWYLNNWCFLDENVKNTDTQNYNFVEKKYFLSGVFLSLITDDQLYSILFYLHSAYGKMNHIQRLKRERESIIHTRFIKMIDKCVKKVFLRRSSFPQQWGQSDKKRQVGLCAVEYLELPAADIY